MDNTIDVITHNQCTGCGACYNKCPVNAIVMKPDAEGFSFPSINSEQCIHCGLCLKTCPVFETKYENNPEPKCYAVMANDEIRKNSSSGGVFTLLAEWVLRQGGVVCGAAYSQDCYSVQQIIITKEEDCHKLRGSKYVQSENGEIYKKVKAYLDNGTPVLFTGTPCQVAAVKAYLEKPYEKLYTLDLVCHGVPSPGVYQKFIEEQEKKYGSKAIQVTFRDKQFGGWNHSTKICFANGEEYQKKRNECSYLKAFLRLLTIRRSCGNCPFAALPRQGDMTIADFWDIHRLNSKWDDRKGTSLVLINSPKGEVMLDALRQAAILCQEAPLQHAVKHNAQIKYSSILNPARSRFFDLLYSYQYGFEKAVDYSLNRKFDIGYIGWWYGANYGSVVTNFALNRVLKDMGKTVLMLEWPILSGEIPRDKPDNKSRRFAKHFYEESLFYHLKDYGKFNYLCETFLVGSDQLWNWWSNRDVDSYYFFLDFADDKHKKIAYATSFGHESAHYPKNMQLKIRYLLSRFDAISVREKSGIAACKKKFGVGAVQTMDPVFLCRMEDYENAIALSNVKLKGLYVLAYILNPTADKVEAVRYAAQELGQPYYIILDGQGNFEELKKQVNDPNVLDPMEIADWLKYFKYASYVVTDSFHGFCYSIIFKHNMSVFPNKVRGLSRFESLAEITGLQDRFVWSKEEMIANAPWNKPVDFIEVQNRMRPQIEFSRQWLKDALERKKSPRSARELVWKRMLWLQKMMCYLRWKIRQIKPQK